MRQSIYSKRNFLKHLMNLIVYQQWFLQAFWVFISIIKNKNNMNIVVSINPIVGKRIHIEEWKIKTY